MGNITLHTHIDSGMTCVPNDFIDSYLPRANGEYVKLYLYLLRTVSFEKEVSLEAVAEDLEYTEKDIRRALSYWEKEGLLYLDFDADGSLSGICFDGFGKKADAPVHAAEAAATQESPKKAILSADRIAALSAQKDIEELLFIAAQYIGKPLSPSEISNILYFYDELHFSKDLIEYLIEYCVSKGSKSRHYMEKVAFEWAKEGIHTVHEAKQSTNLYNRNYYKILNAFGIKGRGPAKPETEYMDCWLNTYHFTLEIILEACARTIAQTQRPNFQYADKILSEWHKSNVHHLSDIKALDAAHLKKQKAEKPKTAPANKFNNFHQRDYDFEQLEKQLLNT